VVDEELAARRHLAVSSTWQVGAYTMAQLQQAGSETPTPPAGPTVALRIVGIVRHPGDLLPIITDQDNLHVNHNDLYLTPAYWQHYGPDLAGYGVNTAVALHRGQADLSRLVADVQGVSDLRSHPNSYVLAPSSQRMNRWPAFPLVSLCVEPPAGIEPATPSLP
jgi:hypothetical protein